MKPHDCMLYSVVWFLFGLLIKLFFFFFANQTVNENHSFQPPFFPNGWE